MTSNIKEELYPLVCNAVADASTVVRKFEAENKVIKSYNFFPRMVYQDSGYPYFSTESDAPLDYGSIFDDHKDASAQQNNEENSLSILGSLDAERVSILEGCKGELEAILMSLDGDARQYFERLLVISEKVLALTGR